MKLNEEMFAIKLYELEQQYRTMQSRIRLCGRLDGPELEQELARARQEYRDKALALQENRDKLDEIAGYLYEKETITGDEFMKILNR